MRANAGETDLATWRFTDLPPGDYRVSTTWIAAGNRRDNNLYTLYDGIAGAPISSPHRVDQSVAPDYEDPNPEETVFFNAFTTSFFYDAAGNVTETRRGASSTDPHSGLLINESEYHHTGRLEEVVNDGSGRSTRSIYDNLGRRMNTSNLGQGGTADPLTSTFQYDASGQLRFSTDALGRVTETIYDNRGLVTQVVFADGTAMNYEYDGIGNRVSMTDELGRTTSYSYDSRNRLVRATHPDGATETMRYDGVGRLVETVRSDLAWTESEYETDSQRTVLEYDAAGRLLTTTTVVGTTGQIVTRSKYNRLGELIESVDGEQNVTQYFYDQMSRVVKTMVLSRGDGAEPSPTVRTAASDPPVFVSTNAYDAEGNVVETTVYDTRTGSGNIPEAVLRGSNAEVLQAWVENSANTDGLDDTAFLTTVIRYDNFNRPADTIRADGASTSVEYDGAGRVRFAQDERGARSENRYDAYGRLLSTILPGPGNSVSDDIGQPTTQFVHDGVGNVISSTDPNGGVTTFEYDSRNRLVRTTDPIGSTSETIYDKLGQVVATIDALGIAVATRYDNRGRVTRRSWVDPDGSDPATAPFETYEYDGVDNLAAMTDVRGYRTTYGYDRAGRRITERSPRTHANGGVVERLGTEDVDGLNSSDAITRFEYDDNGNRESVEDANGAVTAYIYDELNRLTHETLPDPDGDGDTESLVLSRSYDGYSNVVSTREENLAEVVYREDTFRYDKRNRLVEEIFNDGGPDYLVDSLRNLYEYDTAGNLTAKKEAIRQNQDGEFFTVNETTITRYAYDLLGRLREEHLDAAFGVSIDGYAGRHFIAYDYDLVGNLVREVYTIHDHDAGEPNGINRELTKSITTEYAYDAVNRLIATTADVGGINAVSKTAYDAVGNVQVEFDPTGIATGYGYDNLYRLTETVYADPNPYDSLPGAVDPTGLIDRFEYDAAGNLSKHTNGAGDETAYLYNTFGQQIEERIGTEGLSIATVYKYDKVGNRAQVVDPNGNITQFKYDAVNRVTKEIRGAGSDDPAREYHYNSKGDLESVVDREGRVTSYEYDGLDRITTESWHANESDYILEVNPKQTLRWSYDKFGRVLKSSHADTTLSQQHYYSDTYTYDSLGRLTSHLNSDPDADTDPLSYKGNPLLLQAYSYDHLAGLPDGAHSSTQYTQTLDGATTYATTDFSTDALGRLVRIDDAPNLQLGIDAKTIDYSYDDAGRMTSTTRVAETDGNAGADFFFATDYHYDPSGRLLGLDHLHTQADADPFATYRYAFDNASRITRVDANTRADSVAVDRIEDYTHDGAGRLQSWDSTRLDVSGAGPDLGSQVDRSFELDAAGNRDRVLDNGVPVENQVITPNQHNELASDANYSYEYDGEGNLIKRTENATQKVTEYVWDHRNRLSQVISKPSAGAAADQTVRYYYNNDDLRIRKIVEGVKAGGFRDIQAIEHYIYNGNQVAAVLDGIWADTSVGVDDTVTTGGHYQRRVQNGVSVDAPLFEEVFRDPTTGLSVDELLWAAADHAGSVRDVFDKAHALVEHREYDAYGDIQQVVDGNEVAKSTDDLAIDAAFAGREWDADADFYYNRARWYDAASARFISQDPIGFAGGDANLYRFGGGDPVNFRDPSGFSSEAWGGTDINFGYYPTDLGGNDISFASDHQFDIGVAVGASGWYPQVRELALPFAENSFSTPSASDLLYGRSLTAENFHRTLAGLPLANNERDLLGAQVAGEVHRSSRGEPSNSVLASTAILFGNATPHGRAFRESGYAAALYPLVPRPMDHGSFIDSAAGTIQYAYDNTLGNPYVAGSLEAVGGTFGMVGSGGAIYASGGTAVPAYAAFLYSFDQFQAGLRTAYNGEFTQTIGASQFGGSVEYATGSQALGNLAGFSYDVGGGLATGRYLSGGNVGGYAPRGYNSAVDDLVIDYYNPLAFRNNIPGQAHHLNQNAAFRTVIASRDGISTKLIGDAIGDIGSPHYITHEGLEAFWGVYRRGGLQGFGEPTNSAYNRALYNSLQEAGVPPSQALRAVQQAKAQQLEYGLRGSNLVPVVPRRLNQVAPE